jgi:hypothetical protein
MADGVIGIFPLPVHVKLFCQLWIVANPVQPIQLLRWVILPANQFPLVEIFWLLFQVLLVFLY